MEVAFFQTQVCLPLKEGTTEAQSTRGFQKGERAGHLDWTSHSLTVQRVGKQGSAVCPSAQEKWGSHDGGQLWGSLSRSLGADCTEILALWEDAISALGAE